MERESKVIFVCEHGAAKSIVAATYFNQLASQMGLDLRAVARGTHPDRELSQQAVLGLSEDGLTPTEATPQKLTADELQAAQCVITFCDLPTDYHTETTIENWKDVPPVGKHYAAARDVIVERIHQLLKR